MSINLGAILDPPRHTFCSDVTYGSPKGLGLNFCAAFAVEEFEDCLARIDKMEDELRSVFESMDAGKFKSREAIQ